MQNTDVRLWLVLIKYQTAKYNASSLRSTMIKGYIWINLRTTYRWKKDDVRNNECENTILLQMNPQKPFSKALKTLFSVFPLKYFHSIFPLLVGDPKERIPFPRRQWVRWVHSCGEWQRSGGDGGEGGGGRRGAGVAQEAKGEEEDKESQVNKDCWTKYTEISVLAIFYCEYATCIIFPIVRTILFDVWAQ